MQFKDNGDCIDIYDDGEISGTIFIDDCGVTFSTDCYFCEEELKKIVKVMELARHRIPKDIITFKDTENYIEITKNSKYNGSINKNDYVAYVGTNNTSHDLTVIINKIKELKK